MNNINAPAEIQQEAQPPLTCLDLAQAGRWNQSLCCVECHEDPNQMILDAVTAHDPLDGYQRAWLCCHCLELLPDWHTDKVYVCLPEHE